MRFLSRQQPIEKTKTKDVDDYLQLFDQKVLEIKREILEEVERQKANGADQMGIEWSVIKKLRKYGIDVNLAEFKRKYKSRYQ